MSLAALQKTIDDSSANAHGFSRELFTEDRTMSAEQLQAFINQDGAMTVSTLNKEGKPHAAIVAASCADGALYIGVTPRTALLGNLRRNEDVAFSIKDKVVGRARARLVGPAAEQKQLAPSLTPIMRGAIEGDWPGYIYELEPIKVFPAQPE